MSRYERIPFLVLASLAIVWGATACPEETQRSARTPKRGVNTPPRFSSALGSLDNSRELYPAIYCDVSGAKRDSATPAIERSSLPPPSSQDSVFCNVLNDLSRKDTVLLVPQASKDSSAMFAFLVLNEILDDSGNVEYEAIGVGPFIAASACDSVEAILRNVMLPTRRCARTTRGLRAQDASR